MSVKEIRRISGAAGTEIQSNLWAHEDAGLLLVGSCGVGITARTFFGTWLFAEQLFFQWIGIPLALGFLCGAVMACNYFARMFWQVVPP